MAAAFLDEGRKTVLDILFDGARSPKLRLFTDTFTITQIKVFADFHEPGFAGYAAIDLSAMAGAIINANDQGEKDINPATFTCNANGAQVLIYGYFVTIKNMGGADKVVFADKFPGGTAIQNNGDAISFPLTFLDELGT
jgi:hypothetical protein